MGHFSTNVTPRYDASDAADVAAYELDRGKTLTELHPEINSQLSGGKVGHFGSSRDDVFLSYKYSETVQKVNLFRNQAEYSSQLRFNETSSPTRYPDNWKYYAERDIKRSDHMVVMVDEHTYQSKPVEWEVKKAHEHGVHVLAVKTSDDVKVPKAISQHGDKVVPWKLDKIQRELDKGQPEDKSD